MGESFEQKLPQLNDVFDRLHFSNGAVKTLAKGGVSLGKLLPQTI